jgi:hypothetical protein
LGGGGSASGIGDGGAGHRTPELAAALSTRLSARWWFVARFNSRDERARDSCAMSARGVSSWSGCGGATEGRAGGGIRPVLAGGRGGEGVRSVVGSCGDACMKSSKSSKRFAGIDVEDVEEKSPRSDEVEDEKLS